MTERDEDPAREIALECVGVRIRLLNRVVTRIYDDALRGHGVKLAQLNILTAIALRGPLLSARLGRILSIEKSTLSRNLRVLVSNGWIRLRQSAGRKTIQTTAAGRRLLRTVAPSWRSAQDRVRDLMGARAASAVANVVDRIWKDEAPQ